MADHISGQDLQEARRAFLQPGKVDRRGALAIVECLQISSEAKSRVRGVIDRAFERVTVLGTMPLEGISMRIEALTIRCGCCS